MPTSCKTLLALTVLLLASTPLLAQAASESASDPAASPRQHGPRKALGVLPARMDGDIKVFASGNWSGYAVVGTSFTQATGSWVVPAVDCTTTPHASASFWVGIDGWDNATVEQTGTDSDCDGRNPTYYAWYEFAPKAGVTITSVPVSPGDSMSAQVSYDGTQFIVTITDEATGDSFSTTAMVPRAQRTSAEWIAEKNGTDLSDFGTAPFGMDFTNVFGTNSATDAATSGTIGDFGNDVQASVTVNQGVEDASPSHLSPNGTSFTVTWKAE